MPQIEPGDTVSLDQLRPIDITPQRRRFRFVGQTIELRDSRGALEEKLAASVQDGDDMVRLTTLNRSRHYFFFPLSGLGCDRGRADPISERYK